MRDLHYTLYCGGRSGFSNLVMSAELGVIASFLLKRRLVLEGNITPPANVLALFRRQGTLFNLEFSRNEALATDAYIKRLDEAMAEIGQSCSNPNPTCTQVGSMLYCN